jgi:uncharacterized membrane protein YcjF (UPF0283 family)
VSHEDRPVIIRAFRKDAYQEVSLFEDVEVATKQTPFPIFTTNSRNDSQIIEEKIVKTADDYVKVAERKARNTLNKATHYTGIIIVIAIIVACIWLLVNAFDKTQQIDVATKLIFLGAI